MRILILGIVAFTILVLSANSSLFINAQNSENGDDLIFNVRDLTTSPTTIDFQINGEVWEDVCPSNQCQIEEDEYSSYVVTPDPEDTDPSFYTTLYFYVRDNVTNKDLTPLQKNFAERYQLSFSCNVNSVNDIIEQENNIIYKCSGDYTSLGKYNKEDTDSSYYYNVEATYDSQSDTFNATGKFDSKI